MDHHARSRIGPVAAEPSTVGTSAATAAARDRSDKRGVRLHLQRKPPDTYKIVIGATDAALSVKRQ